MAGLPRRKRRSHLVAAALPRLRQIKWDFRSILARAGASVSIGRSYPVIIFVVGCGRSGTTLLGTLLSRHRQITYLNEPIDVWNAIDRRTDYLDFFGGKGLCHLNEGHVNPRNIADAQRIFANMQFLFASDAIIEKLPVNSWRLRWLKQLFPHARFLHLVRNGRDVVSSITRLSRDRSYRVGGRTNMNKWWGVSNYKLKQLVREAPLADGYRSKLEAILVSSPYDFQLFAAHEWISANRDIEESKERLGLSDLDYMLIRYEDLIRDPVGRLRELNRWIGLVDPGTQFYKSAETLVQPRNSPSTDEVALPGWLLDDFKSTMTQYGYCSAVTSTRMRRTAGQRYQCAQVGAAEGHR
jgi:Sulfotransferase family